MSKTSIDTADLLFTTSEGDFRSVIEETFTSHEKSRQATGDSRRHIDGEHMRQYFGMRSLSDVLREKEAENHPLATHPRAFVDALVHIHDFDARVLDTPEVLDRFHDEYPDQFQTQYPEPRRSVLEWVAEGDTLQKLNKGGTDTFLHGLPGSTKTTCMQYLAVRLQEANYEDVVWAGMPGRSEWTTLARWATVLWPSDVSKRVKCVPYNPIIDPFHVEMGTIARDVVEYDNPEHLMTILRRRPKGEFYVVYPDPQFRLCEYLTGCFYQDAWAAADQDGITDLVHWWFAFAEARARGENNYWTSLMLDEADELLDADAARNDHDYYDKVKLFRNSFRKFRKEHLSLYLAAHNREEVHPGVRKKLRWTLTMNQEKMPDDAPVDEDYTEQMDPGEGMIWKAPKFSSFSWPNMSRYLSVPAKFIVEYPEWDAEKRQTARGRAGGDGRA